MKRRAFISMLAGSAVAASRRAQAQQFNRMRRVGVLLPLTESDPEQSARREGFLQALGRLGWQNGGNLQIDIRHAGGPDKFASLAKEMVALQPEVIFAQSTGFVTAVQRETRSIPVVFANVSDPIGAGFAATLARPGGNLTGMLLFEGVIATKWVSMLKEISPELKRVAFMIDPNTTPFDYFFQPGATAAASLGIEIVPARVRDRADIQGALEAIAKEPATGFVVAPGSTMLRNRDLVISLGIRHALPAVYPERVYAIDGGLVSYGTADLIEPFRQAASYIDRILRGEKPADLPVQAPTRYSTVVNLKTAKALGLEISPTLLALADELIE